MRLNESIVENAASEWLGEQGYAVGHGPHLAPGEPAAERDSFGDVMLLGRLREALRITNIQKWTYFMWKAGSIRWSS